MARIALNRPDIAHRPPNFTPEATEFGDSWDAVLSALNTMFTELYTGTSSISGTKTYTGTQNFNSTVNVEAGTGTGSFRPSGAVTTTAGPVGSSATNTTQTLASYSLPASTLAAVGQQLVVTAWGTTANNAAPKKVALVIGGATYASATQTGAAYDWTLQGTVLKQAANAQNELFTGWSSGAAITTKNQTDSSVDTAAITIAVTCADASAAQSNITLYGFTVDFFG